MRTRAVLLPLGLLVLLAGCAVAPSAGPTAAPSAPEQTAGPEPEPTTVSIEIGASEVSIVDSDGAVTTYDYLTPGETLVTAFTQVFGTEPEQTPYPGHIEAPPGTDYSWGGFTLRVQEFESVPPSEGDPGASNIGYVVSSASVGDVAVSSKGVMVGDPASTLELCPGSSGEEFSNSEGARQTWRCVDTASLGDDPHGDELFNSVGARVSVDSGLIVELHALLHNYGA